MPLGTLDRTPPPFFRQGPSALTRLAFFSLLAIVLMVADTRYQVARPLRASIATVLYPLQWLVMRPVAWAQEGNDYFESLQTAQAALTTAEKKLNLQSQRAGQVEQLSIENNRLRQLLGLRERMNTPGQAAQVLYDAADPYTRKVIIDRGMVHGVATGSPVLDETGVLGQVTRVYPLVSEVTLLTDKEQSIPVQVVRTGLRAIAYGNPSRAADAGTLDLRFMASHADVQVNDVLVTSGLDGVYPAGLAVARVARVDRNTTESFARIVCVPLGGVDRHRHVLVLIAAPTPPAADVATAKGKD